jgi:DNA-binding protein H-NS
VAINNRQPPAWSPRLCQQIAVFGKKLTPVRNRASNMTMMGHLKGVDVLDEKAVHSPSIVGETGRKDLKAFSAHDLGQLSVDELWAFRDEFETLLATKIAIEIRELERRIDRLNIVIGDSSKPVKPARRHYPPVLPKYRNPISLSETWSGRGRQPRWLKAQLELGKRLEDFTT